MNKAFRNWREGAIHLNFPNGNQVSTTWANYSYSENYNKDMLLVEETRKYKTDRIDPVKESDTCEILVSCGDRLLKKLEKKYNDGYSQPFGYVKIEDWLDIVNRVAKEKNNAKHP